MSLAVSNSAKNFETNRPDDCQATLAVILPIRNEERYIARTLDQLLDQSCEGVDVELVVVDGRSTDRTRDIVDEYVKRKKKIRLLDNPRHLSSAARNIGIQNTSSEYVVIIDGHCEIPSSTYFQDLIEAFATTGADCLGRPQPLDVSEATALQRAIALARTSRLGHHPDSFIYSDSEVECPAISVAVAYRRSVFDQVGLFDEDFDACEDCELNHRIDQAGLRCRLIPQLLVCYEPRDSLRGLFRQLVRYGRGRVRLAWKHPDAFTWTSMVPAGFVMGIGLGGLACFVMPGFRPIFLSAVGLYLLVVLLTSVKTALTNQQFDTLLWLPAVFATIHIGAGTGAVAEIFRQTFRLILGQGKVTSCRHYDVAGQEAR